VLAKGLICPNFSWRESDGSACKSCLGDFGKPNLEIVLPLTLLREHDPLAVVRAYGEERHATDWESFQPRRTCPSWVTLRHEEEIDAETTGPLDPVEEWQLQNEYECLLALKRDSREKDLATSLDAMREAELLAHQAQVKGDFESLKCWPKVSFARTFLGGRVTEAHAEQV
jgi:hypothetical protein